ncbi:hypothetical protein M407DRAFT_22704 [Tulasnella calospora MUT 4182]|uniref:Uncharacterized protein n=1 Tax=Tulasnella calospora MUT 4182 TaxID=1051891 RepID=A0A0C3L2V3_9AGAM|nr:hypothetical protein M407DRAFT_22704 [Tulasnella calospora MUT 4182]
MTEVASGSSVGRRLNELQNALDIAPPPVTSSSQAPDNNDDQFDEDYDGEETFEDVTDTMNDHEETKPSKIALGETPVTLAPKCNAAAKEGDVPCWPAQRARRIAQPKTHRHPHLATWTKP